MWFFYSELFHPSFLFQRKKMIKLVATVVGWHKVPSRSSVWVWVLHRWTNIWPWLQSTRVKNVGNTLMPTVFTFICQAQEPSHCTQHNILSHILKYQLASMLTGLIKTIPKKNNKNYSSNSKNYSTILKNSKNCSLSI